MRYRRWVAPPAHVCASASPSARAPGEACVARRLLLDGDPVTVGHVAARASSPRCGPVEEQDTHVLVFPLVGLFARHDSSRRYVVATAGHFVLIAAGQPYRLSYPGAIGDECLTLRFSGETLERLAPAHAAGRALASHALLSPPLALARALLWRRLASGQADRVEAEERGLALVVAAVAALGNPSEQEPARPARQREAIACVLEAIARAPARRWSLAGLAGLVELSPWQLARAFRNQVGVPVYQHLLRARLLAALDRVVGGDGELTAIALDAGFASHSHFTARFRALFGVPPAELRRSAGPARRPARART